jgi:predicted transcriptional regulator
MEIKGILKHETRMRIYQFIMKYPGLNRSELSRKMNIPYTTLEYHLKYLKKRRFLIEKHENRYCRYYVAEEISRRDKDLFNLLRQDMPRKIVMLLIYPRPCFMYPDIYPNKMSSKSEIHSVTFSKEELFEMERVCKTPEMAKVYSLRKHRTTLDFHLNKLIDADIIEKIPSGKEMRYRLKDPIGLRIFLFRYKEALSYNIVDLAVADVKVGINIRTDEIFEIFFEIFPLPFCA